MSGLELAQNFGLKLREGKSFFEPIKCECSLQAVEKILHEKFQTQQANLIAWQIQNIVWGKFDGEKFLFPENVTVDAQDWLECRTFNAQEEFHLKRAENFLRGRYVRDESGKGNFFADSFARLWGEEISAADGFINLLDRERKLFMQVPCDKVGCKWYGLLTRNYIDSDEKTGLSGYVDYRFVSIESAKGGE